jgi:hypothetical protein
MQYRERIEAAESGVLLEEYVHGSLKDLPVGTDPKALDRLS